MPAIAVAARDPGDHALVQQLLPGVEQDPTRLEMGRKYLGGGCRQVDRRKGAAATNREQAAAAGAAGAFGTGHAYKLSEPLPSQLHLLRLLLGFELRGRHLRARARSSDFSMRPRSVPPAARIIARSSFTLAMSTRFN